ncbi:HAD family hydrolase [Treponema sp.]|uniref:HAD family hydrolase n=1 Tax=Treponema sp. TaxID=166 RepID=UPI0025D762BB|nr:HAD family hydrolase [Treponema sp.]MCR5217136.1 HAD family hydrolase [Treponema sp.]
MIEGIKAVAFDIDGTLYPTWKLFIRMPFYFFSHFSFYYKFNKVRHKMHHTAPLGDFFEYQARLYAAIAGLSPADAKKEIKKISYDGLTPFFRKIKPYPHVYESIKAMKDAGLKIGILSDFPPEQKEDIWGIRDLCDVCIGSEESGALKPSKYPFGILAQKLNLKPQEILYVGNSRKYDIEGAKNAGMKSAYILSGIRRLFNLKLKEADFSFKSYRQLKNIVLN